MAYANCTTRMCRCWNDHRLEEKRSQRESNAWFTSHKFIFNEGKITQLVLPFERKKTPENTGSAKLLGKILDTRLTWRYEIDALSKELSSALMNIIEWPTAFNYGENLGHANDIFVLQKKALRAIAEVPQITIQFTSLKRKAEGMSLRQQTPLPCHRLVTTAAKTRHLELSNKLKRIFSYFVNKVACCSF